MEKSIGIYIYENCEVLDFSGPFEVLSTANRICGKANPFNVFLIAETDAPVEARGGYRVLPDHCIESHPKLDILIVVGGDHSREITNRRALNWIAKTSETVSLLVSVCTGSFLLAESGAIREQAVTTHWEDQDDLQARYPALTVQSSKRWVEDGNLITSGGISAGIDMSLYLVEKLTSKDVATETAKQMEYLWNSDPNKGI